jgi:hypothetical protein
MLIKHIAGQFDTKRSRHCQFTSGALRSGRLILLATLIAEARRGCISLREAIKLVGHGRVDLVTR